MQQVTELLATSQGETFDQLRRACDGMLRDCKLLIRDHCNDLVTSKSPSSPISPLSHHHDYKTATSSVNSSFSIENILSSSPQHRNDADHKHQQPDKYHHHHHHQLQRSDESLTTCHNGISQTLQSPPALPLSHAFYGQFYVEG